MGITVEEILKLPIFEQTVLVGGFEGVNNEVLTANITDSPDIANWVRPNQLLLTTAYHFRDQPEQLIPFLRQLHEHNCAGLAIKTKRYIDTLPEGLIEEAERLQFPLIELPNNLLLGDVLNQILEQVLNDKQYELERTFQVHKKFTNLFLKGKGMFEIAQTLSSLIKKNVIILNAHYEPAGDTDILTAKNVLMDARDFIRLKSALLLTTLPENELTPVYWNDTEPVAAVYPVYASGMNNGFICVLDLDPEICRSFNVMPLEQASYIVAYEHMRQEALSEGEKRLRRQFFNDWLDNRLTWEEISKRGKTYGFSTRKTHLICICSIDPAQAGQFMSEADDMLQREKCLLQIIKFIEINAVTAFCEMKDKRIVLALPISPNNFRDADEQKIVDLFVSLQQSLAHDNPATTFSFGISNLASQLSKIPQAFREAQQAIENGYFLRKRAFIHTYRTQQVIELIQSIPDNKLYDFYKSSLCEMAFTDQEEQIELLKTLEVYLNHECSVTKTAATMYLHRNTVINRINRCEIALNFSVKDPIDTLKIRIALVIHRMYGKKDTGTPVID
jgi:purine catabolism regulator